MEEVYNCMLFIDLSISNKISTFEELEKKIKDVLYAMHIHQWFRDSRTLKGPKRDILWQLANIQFKYYKITLACVCGG